MGGRDEPWLLFHLPPEPGLVYSKIGPINCAKAKLKRTMVK